MATIAPSAAILAPAITKEFVPTAPATGSRLLAVVPSLVLDMVKGFSDLDH